MAEIVVTGTHIRGAVSTGPVQAISREDIEKGGFTSVQDALASSPMNFGGGVNVETGGGAVGGRDYAGVGYGVASTANLRGLGSTSTLTLLDGVRLPPQPGGVGVDLSFIPLSAIQRIDVLADGASAIYGSDAVAGVVNLITRSGADAFETRVRYGEAQDGKPDDQVVQTLGGGWSGGDLFLVYEHSDRGDIDTRYREATRGEASPNYVYPEQHQDTVFAKTTQSIAGGWRAYAEGYYSRRDLNQAQNEVPPSAAYTDLFDAVTSTNGGALIVGVKNSPSAAVLIDIYSTIGHGEARQALTPTPIETSQGYPSYLAERRETTAEGGFRLASTLLATPAGPIRFAGGADLSREVAAYSDTGLAKGDFFSRSTQDVYGELSIPLASRAMAAPWLQTATLSVAGRYEHYSDFGATANPKVGLNVVPVEGLTLKADYSTSFRAPSSFEEATAGGDNYLTLAEDLAPNQQNKVVTLYRYGVNSGLRPETARNITGALEYQPPQLPKLRVFVDYYNIDFKNRILQPDPLGLGFYNLNASTIVGLTNRNPTPAQIAAALSGSGLYNLTGNPSLNPAQNPGIIQAIVDGRFQNAAEERTSGLDLGGEWSRQTAVGLWRLTGTATYILNLDERLSPGAAFQSLLNTLYEPVGFKGRAGLSWTDRGWNAVAYLNYTNSYTDNRIPSAPVPIASWTTFDLHLSYTFHDGFGLHASPGATVEFNASNLFNRPPPFVAENTYGYRYDATNASAVGRTLSLQVSKRW